MFLMKNPSSKIGFLLVLINLLIAIPSKAGDGLALWSSASVEKKLAKGLDVDFETEYRLYDNLSQTDRFSIGTSVSYRLYRNSAKTLSVKADLGYNFLKTYNESSITLKNIENNFQEYNEDEDYYLNKHRGYTSLSTQYEIGRFSFSIRERYQFTYNDSIAVKETKYRYSSSLDKLYPKETVEEYKSAKKRNVLRSRFEIDYDMPGFKFNPFASIELFNDIDNGLNLDKTRYSVGGNCSLAKVHSLKIYYVYQNNQDDDEPSGSAIGISYGYEF